MTPVGDARSQKTVLVAHCLLNANARSAGEAHYAGVHAIIGELAGRGYAIVQLPCPEVLHAGCCRQPCAPALLESSDYRELCARLADGVAADVEAYLECGVVTVAVVGLEGDGTCAVNGDSPGVFTSELRMRLDPHNIHFLAISHQEPEDNIPSVLAHLR